MPTLRPAQPSDWPAVEALLLGSTLPLQGAREHFADFVVAEDAGELVGVAGLEAHGKVGLLRSVAVTPACQQRGYAEQLLEAVVEEAVGRGLESVYLLTTTAAQYFERRGFALEPREAAPASLRASAEFNGACPASATFMRRDL